MLGGVGNELVVVVREVVAAPMVGPRLGVVGNDVAGASGERGPVVALNVGGVVESRTLAGRGAETFNRVPKERQKEAVAFLLKHAFATPTKLLNPEIVNRFKYSNVAGDITGQQAGLLRSLLVGGGGAAGGRLGCVPRVQGGAGKQGGLAGESGAGGELAAAAELVG